MATINPPRTIKCESFIATRLTCVHEVIFINLSCVHIQVISEKAKKLSRISKVSNE